MKLNHILYIILLLTILISSCEEMSLDPKVENTFGDEYTWKFGDYAEGILMNAYEFIPARFNSYDNNFLDVATDNAVTNDYGSGIYDLATGGGISPVYNPVGNWSRAYDQFRNIHLFLENGIDDDVQYNIVDETADSLERARLKGEAYFLRAWWGFQLLQDFGGKTNTGTALALGYPIVTKSLTDEEMRDLDGLQRNTYEECVQQIIADIDTAVYYLPVKYAGGSNIDGLQGLGRADDRVAQALKSRVLLYAASPAYQDDDIIQITGMGEFTIVDQTNYEAKWIEAAQAAQQTLDVLVGNIPGLRAGFFNRNNTPGEFIWRKYHNDRNLENFNYPPLNYGNGYTGPSQNLVDAFPASNGYPIDDPRSNYDPQDPYAKRDARLTLNVLHNGQNFIGDPLETFVGGKDSKEAHFQGTRTGYYLRKWLNIGDMLNPENPNNDHHYHALIRKTEILLNFAEASNEAVGPGGIVPGCNQSAVDVVKTIRNNAGFNNHDYVDEVAGQGKDAFRELIQNERRIELAFENHRYYDMRRWLLPLNETVTGMKVTKAADGTLTYEEVEVEERNFNDIRYYYQPIPYNDQVKSRNLINNLGW
jgi:hypothetical protein